MAMVGKLPIDELPNLRLVDENFNSRDVQEKIDTIDEYFVRLSDDGPFLDFRRALGQSGCIHTYFIPLLTTANESVVQKIVKFLSVLTAPVECLLTPLLVQSENMTQVIIEVEHLLMTVKSDFADFQVSQSVVKLIKDNTFKEGTLTNDDCECVLDGLLLLRNVLHIHHSDTQIQNQILWNLFSQSLDKILIQLMTCTQKLKFGMTLVQLVAIIYKDQHVTHLQKLLAAWLENSLSDTSEDNESNTSPKDQEDGDFSPTQSSDPTNSDSSDGDKQKPGDPLPMSPINQQHSNHTHKCYTKSVKSKRKTNDRQNSDADSGFLSLSNVSKSTNDTEPVAGDQSFADLECVSSSSNDDYEEHITSNGRSTSTHVKREIRNGKQAATHACPQHKSTQSQKSVRISSFMSNSHPTVKPMDSNELKRKKLHKRAKKERQNINHHHNPTNEDISLILREFTVDFLLKGYASLVSVLHQQLISHTVIKMDKSHFFWLITYFLKLASQLELGLEHISPVLSYEILSYLIFEGVVMSEGFSVSKQDLKPHLRGMHLVVAAIREFVQALEVYRKMAPYSKDDKDLLQRLTCAIHHTKELRSLFILLIRQFQRGVQSKHYLRDLITTNHLLLLLLEQSRNQVEGVEPLQEAPGYIKDFSSPVIIQKYGHLLEDFKTNGEFVNDCIFTILHHVAGDLAKPEALCQAHILKTFSQIWEIEFEIKDDWADLIEFVIRRFMKVKRNDQKQSIMSSASNVIEETRWSQEDIESLYWMYSSYACFNDPITPVVDAFIECGAGKSKECILQQLLLHELIGFNEYTKILESVAKKTGGFEVDSDSEAGSFTTTKPDNSSEHKPEISDFLPNSEGLDFFSTDISVQQLIKDFIAKEKGLVSLQWIQQQILEACYVKFKMETHKKGEDEAKMGRYAEPVPHHFAVLGWSIPIVPWTKLQEISLMSPPFVLALHKLGFEMASDIEKIYPRMPYFWSSATLLAVATQFGPLPNSDKLKFDYKEIPIIDLQNEYRHTLDSSIVQTEVRSEGGLDFSRRNSAGRYSINWTTLINKTMRLSHDQSEADEKEYCSSDSEHMDDCASLKALPPAPSDISEDGGMFSSAAESDDEDE